MVRRFVCVTVCDWCYSGVTFDCGSPLIALSSRQQNEVFVLHDISETYTTGLDGTFRLSKRSYIYTHYRARI